jgi:hypothetical protein
MIKRRSQLECTIVDCRDTRGEELLNSLPEGRRGTGAQLSATFHKKLGTASWELGKGVRGARHCRLNAPAGWPPASERGLPSSFSDGSTQKQG